MKLKKPSFWDLTKPNFLSYLLIPFSLPIILRNFLFYFLKKKKISKIKIFTKEIVSPMIIEIGKIKNNIKK